LVTVLLPVFGDEQQFLAAGSDLFAAFPEAPMDSVPAWSFRESAPDPVVALDRQVLALVAALMLVPARVPRLFQRTQRLPEPPA
jgi:hypothetical protein